jgi:O-antigen/teichoic acid export membrane protein
MINKTKNFIYNLLRKSQKFTGTDNLYIAKYGSYLTIGSVISMVAAFLLSIAFAQLLPKETYGQYKYILSIMGILAISSLQGMNAAIVRGVAKGFEGVFIKGFKTKLKWSLLGSIASIGMAIYFWLQGNIEFTVSFLIIAFFLPLFKSGEIYQSYLSGKKFFGQKVNYTTLIQILATAFLILTLFLTKSLIILILVYFFSYSILRMFFYLWTIKKIKPNKKYDSKTISYGKHLSFIDIIALIAEQIDKILLFHFMGPMNLAIYSFAILPVEQIRTPLQNIQELALPKLSIRPINEIKKTLPKKLFKSIIFILIMIAVYIILVPYFFKIFYPQYIDSVFYSRLFSFDLLVFPVSMMVLALQAKMKTKELYKINIINPIIRIILFIVLIPLYGILGAIIAILLSQIFYFFIAWFFFKKCN